MKIVHTLDQAIKQHSDSFEYFAGDDSPDRHNQLLMHILSTVGQEFFKKEPTLPQWKNEVQNTRNQCLKDLAASKARAR